MAQHIIRGEGLNVLYLGHGFMGVIQGSKANFVDFFYFIRQGITVSKIILLNKNETDNNN